MDITVEVMLPPRGELDLSRAMHGRYRVLAPIAVYARKTLAEVGMPRTGYLHVADVPVTDRGSEERTLQHLNAVLCEPWENADRSLRERRKWCGVPVAVPSAVVAQLLAERQASVSWAEFRALMRHQVEIRNLADEDV